MYMLAVNPDLVTLVDITEEEMEGQDMEVEMKVAVAVVLLISGHLEIHWLTGLLQQQVVAVQVLTAMVMEVMVVMVVILMVMPELIVWLQV